MTYKKLWEKNREDKYYKKSIKYYEKAINFLIEIQNSDNLKANIFKQNTFLNLEKTNNKKNKNIEKYL